ncbi:MAG: DUF1206 domain-containing protein [Ornithinibacter sp.]
MDTSSATSAAREAGNSRVVEYGARVGFAILGVLHLLIGYIALKVAWGKGGGSKQADSSGALKTLASSSTGSIVLWIGVVGFALLAVWSITEGIARRQDKTDLTKLLSKGVLYAFFAWTTFKIVALGQSSSSEKQTEGFAASLMGNTGGRLLVGVIGLVVLGVAGYHIYKGWAKKFLEDLEGNPGEWAVRAGRVGYVAKGIALVVVGFFFVYAAWTADPKKTQGLDGALKTLKEAPGGPVILTLVALGLAAYGVYSFARAKYAKL